MSEYKLTYFDVKGGGRAELIRLIFHASGTKFIDNRVEYKFIDNRVEFGPDWPALKLKIPHGTLPALEFNGKIYGQSISIARFAARQTGLAGKTPEEELRADQYVDDFQDFSTDFYTARFEKDEAKRAELMKELQTVKVPKYLEKIAKILKENGGSFFVGTSLTWADLAMFNSLELVEWDPATIDKIPELKAFKKKIEQLPKISAYLKTRPVTAM